MAIKLTLVAEPAVIETAKEYARNHQTSFPGKRMLRNPAAWFPGYGLSCRCAP